MTGGNYEHLMRPAPLPPTFHEIQEMEAERYWKRLVKEIHSFSEAVPEGYFLVVTLLTDHSFCVVNMKRSGDYVILDGKDADNNDGRVLQHRSQLSIRMQNVPNSATPRGTFGFIEPGGKE